MGKDYIIHTPEEIARIRVAAAMTAKARDRIAEFVRPGMSTKELDIIAGEVIRSMGGKCAFLGYHGFPGNICISVNDEVVHGIGNPERFILKGDIVSVDVGVEYEGGVGDTARTVYVGDDPMPADVKKQLQTEGKILSSIQGYEVAFHRYNFLHLTGIKLNKGGTASAIHFYQKCLDKRFLPLQRTVLRGRSWIYWKV